MNRIFPYKTKTTRCETGEVVDEEDFQLVLSPEASVLDLALEELHKKDVGVYSWPKFPKEWKAMNALEKQLYVENNQFDLEVESIYFRGREHVIEERDVEYAGQFAELKGLHIYNNSLSEEHLAILLNLTKLDHFLIRGYQFTDNCIKYFQKLKELRNLDIFDTSISAEGRIQLEAMLPENCQIWGP